MNDINDVNTDIILEDAGASADTTKTNDTTALAKSVSERINYKFLKDILVKPLEVVKVKKEVSVPVVKETTNDPEFGEVHEYDEVEKKEMEVDSAYRKGIVLKVPSNIEDIFVGDVIIFNDRFSSEFDLLKDSRLVKPYDIIAIEK